GSSGGRTLRFGAEEYLYHDHFGSRRTVRRERVLRTWANFAQESVRSPVRRGFVAMSLHFTPELAYIGPGAGFAFLGSFLTLLGGLLLGVVSVLLWPFRLAWRAASGRQGYKHAKIRKLIFLGLDGLDPGLAEKFMAEGKLPNLSRLQQEGGFKRLRTTFPPLSPVAWSTFATGVSPARHNMFDFLNRNLKSYQP